MTCRPKVETICSQEQFENIHSTVSKSRANSKQVKVDKQALINLLIDHSTILGEIDYE
jgi:hypothetical protein